MKKITKWLALMLCVLMAASSLPFTAFATAAVITFTVDGTEYALCDGEEKALSTGTVSAKYAGEFTVLYLKNVTIGSLKITEVAHDDKAVMLSYEGANTITRVDTEFLTADTETVFATLENASDAGTMYISGKDASSVLNVFYLQPNEPANDSYPGDYAVYAGIYSAKNISFTGSGTVNVNVQTDFHEGGDTEGNGYIATVGVYSKASVNVNAKNTTDNTVINIDVNAEEVPYENNDGYVYGIYSVADMTLAGNGGLNVCTLCEDATDKSSVADIYIASKTLYFGSRFDGNIVFRGYMKLHETANILGWVAPLTFAYGAGAKNTDYIICDYNNEQFVCYNSCGKTEFDITGAGFYNEVPFAMEATQAFTDVADITYIAEGCYVQSYDENAFTDAPVIAFNGNTMTVSGTPVSYGSFDNAFTVHVLGYSKANNKYYAYDESFNLEISDCTVKEYVTYVKPGDSFNGTHENYDGYDDYHETPLGYYDTFDNTLPAATGSHDDACKAYLTGNKIKFVSNAAFLAESGLSVLNGETAQFEGEVQLTTFRLNGTINDNIYLNDTFLYADIPAQSGETTVYKQRIIGVENPKAAFKGYFIKGTGISKTISSDNAVRLYTNAEDFGLTVTTMLAHGQRLLRISGTPTKTGRVDVVYRAAVLVGKNIVTKQYLAQYYVLENEPVERHFPDATVGIPYTHSEANDGGSMSSCGNNITTSGLTYGVGINSTVSGTPTATGEYYGITCCYNSKTGEYKYYKDVVKVVEKAPDAVITEQPKGGKVKQGETIRLSVTATGETLTYLWVLSDGEKETPVNNYAGASGGDTANAVFTPGSAFWTTEGKSLTFYCYVNGIKSDAAVFTAEAAPAYTLGDINADSNIDAADARLALRSSVGLETLNETQTLAADVDKSGKVDAADARYILRASVGLQNKDFSDIMT